MANYVKFKQGLKKDFNTTNQPLTNGMIYFVIDENNNGSIYYDTIVDGKQATKKGTVHRVKFSGLPIKITGSVTGTGVISKDGETIEINTLTNHSHGLAHQDFTVTLSDDDTNLKWTRLGNQNGEGFWLKSVRGNVKAPAWFQPNNGAGVAFGGGSTKGIISIKYNEPSVRFAGGNGDAPVWYFTITGANNKSYDLSKIGGHSSDSAKLDHNVTFKIASTADATKGGNGTTTNLSGAAVDLYLPSNLSGFDNIQSTRFQGTADNADTVDYFHMDEEKYKYETTQKQPTAGADWCIKISTPVWNSTSETIYLSAKGNNSWGTIILKTGSRQNNWWGYATNYNGTGIIGVYKLVSDSDNVYIKINGAYTSVRIRTTFNPTISIPTTIPDYKFTSVPRQGGFFSNAIYTDTLTFTTPKYWANIPISDSSKTDTQPTFNTAYVSNWWRSTGNTGWWNETHLGGITMEDKTYVKVAGNKSFLIPNGSLKIGGNGDIFFATGDNDATLKIYGQTNTEYGIETIAIQTCFDNQDPQISTYTTQYANRCNLLLQPRGGQVYIGKNLTAVGDVGYKLLVGGNQWIEGNLVFNGAKEIKFIGSKATYSMIRFIDNTSDNYGNGISIGGGGSTVIGAGESAMSYVTNGGDEKLFLLSDGAINIEAGGNTISNRKGLQVTSDGHILPIKTENSNPNAQDLGSAADYWRNLYINNITLQGQIGNRLVWTDGSKILQAGYHYADTDRIAINTAARPGFNFYVNGISYFNGNTYIHRNSIIKNASEGTGDVVLNVLGYKASGYPLYKDPEFASGTNNIRVYNNADNNAVTHALVADTTCGNSSGRVLKITHTGSGFPGFGGFVQHITSRANAIFIQIFRAKIPTGRNLATASNSMGNDYKDEWLTPTTGTGKWEWYARRVICGAGGTFSTGGHVYIKDGATPTTSAPLVWYLSYCNVIDVTKGNYDGLKTRYSDFVIYDSGEDGKDNKTPINDKYVAKITTKVSNGTTFTLRGLNGAGNELTDAVLTIPNAGDGKAGLITNAAQGIYGEKTLYSDLRFANVSTGTSSTTWLIGHRGSNGTNSGSGGANGANLAGKINDLTIEVNSSSGQGLTLPATQGELLTWQQRPIMAQLPAQGSSTTILNNANYKTAYLATTNNGNASMGLASANWYHVMNFRHLNNNGCNSQFVLPLNHNGQAAWRLSSGTTWNAWNYIFDDHHAMVPASNNVYNIGSTSNYWATGYINTLYVAGNAYANGGNRIPTTGNTTGTIGSATVPVYSDNGVLKTITSYSGNAATATVASKLSTNAGSSTRPVYFSGGVPIQCSDTLGVNISGNAAKATYTTQLLGVQNNGSNTPYSVAEGNLIRAVWNVKGDSRWYLKAGSYNCRVNYADNAVDADTVDGYHASDLFSGGYKTTVDLSSLNNNLYYPVTGVSIPTNGYHKIKVSVQLNSGTKPSWATHNNGFTTNVELYTTACGWGTTQGETIILNDSYNFTNCGQVVGFTQNGNNSVPVLWLKGGGKYFVECDYNALWTTRTSLYYTYGKAGDTYTQTVEPQSSYPGFKAGNGGAINGTIRAGQVYGAVWNDYAEYRQTKKYVQPGYCVIETGKGDLIKSSKRLQPGANIVSDTFGFAIGETEQTKTPLAVSGRVLAYPYEDRDSYQAGDPVCSGPNGTISKMTREEVREYPDRIIGTVSEIPNYEIWGTGNVKVDNRIWIKVK